MKKIPLRLLSIFMVTIVLGLFLGFQAEAGSGRPMMGGRGSCEIGGGFGGQGAGPGMGRMDGMGPGRQLWRHLDLSVEQQRQMHKIRFDYLKKTVDLEDQLGLKRLERRELLSQETMNWEKIDLLTDEIGALEAKLEKQRLRHRLEVEKILTPEQLQKLDELRCPMDEEADDDEPNLPPRGRGMGPGRGKGMGMGL